MNVRQILEEKGREVATFGPDATMNEAARHLAEKGIGALVVMAGDAIAGILSERDAVRAIASLGASALERPLSDFMTSDVKSCNEESTVEEVMDLMTDGRFRHLPVVEDGKMVGIISIGDVVKRRIREAQQEADSLKQYIAS
ncbi:CBS domain-containing protein [Notoacmeibacter sp. MSK16QG-6]|uniref:CBS domain-containing protein n=1 Tax=Notoacmeibacter sp. MSK16QG-6 TaxID=2957982 RepID=UPI0020A208C7|nr:CBS domain-containing protein [Notoacmeibacter sp. MSK16QG-6]MCP1197857.1 CBS domain-containing protein [Notoacmeibacter sp. MSK16QG-6]